MQIGRVYRFDRGQAALAQHTVMSLPLAQKTNNHEAQMSFCVLGQRFCSFFHICRSGRILEGVRSASAGYHSAPCASNRVSHHTGHMEVMIYHR